MRKVVFLLAVVLLSTLVSFGQVAAPRASQKQTITQTVGDATVSIVYHRPNVNGRKVWGGLVPYDKVWRSGANEATVFEVSRDVMIDGKPLPAGKYSLHTIPGQTGWVVIFNKKSDQWGSFTYDEKLDALRVPVKPVPFPFRESLAYDFETITPTSSRVVLHWDKLGVPFTVDIGDIHGRVMPQMREAITTRKPEDPRPLNQAASYVMTFKVKDSYSDALGWLDTSIGMKETMGNLYLKARLLNEQGKTAEAIVLAEKAVTVGRASTPPASAEALNQLVETIAEWKAKK